MSYIDNNLLQDEVILYRTKKHVIIFLTPVALTIIAIIFYLHANHFISRFAFLPTLAAIFSWGYTLLDYFTSDYAVTNKRILLKEGFFFRHANDTRLATVANLSVNQSLLGQILNYGTVIVNTFGGSGDPFSAIDRPLQFQKCLQEQVNKI